MKSSILFVLAVFFTAIAYSSNNDGQRAPCQEPPPVILFSPDSFVCGNDSILLTAYTPYTAFSYSWSNGANTQSIWVDSTATFTVTVTDADNCTYTSALQTVRIIDIARVPIISSNIPAVVCDDGFLYISADFGQIAYGLDSVLWFKDGLPFSPPSYLTLFTILINEPGEYTVQGVEGPCIGPMSPPLLVEGADGNIIAEASICGSGPMFFYPYFDLNLNFYEVYDLNGNPAPVAGNDHAYVTESGTYIIQGNWSADSSQFPGCEIYDTVMVNIINEFPEIYASDGFVFGPTVSVCPETPVEILLDPQSISFVPASYTWSTGDTTSSSYVVATTNVYLQVTSPQGCVFYSNELSVIPSEEINVPVISLNPGNDSIFCPNGSAYMTADFGSSNNSIASVMWYLDSVAFSPSNLGVYQLGTTLTGQYYAVGTTFSGCVSRPSNSITLSTITDTLFAERIICSSSSTFYFEDYFLHPVTWNYVEPQGGENIRFDTIRQAYNISESGSFLIYYSIPGYDCIFTAGLDVIITPPVYLNLSSDTTLCSPGVLTLSVLNQVHNSYVWSDGTIGPSIQITASGTYFCTAGIVEDCNRNSDTISVTINGLPLAPVITPAGPVQLCAGNNQVLTSSVPNVQWFNGSTSLGTSTTLTINTAGNYYAVNSNACGTLNSNTVSVTSISCVPATQLRSADCGKLTFNLQSSIVANLVSGATHYEFQFKDSNDVNVIATRYQTSRTCAIANVTPALQWGTKYIVRVRAYIGAQQGIYGNPCLIGFVSNPANGIALTQLRAQDCGKLNFTLSSTIYANQVTGATQYEFEFSNPSNNNVVATKLQVNYFLSLNSVTPALQWGTQYNVRIRAYIGSTAGTYGPVCLIGLIPDPAGAGVPPTQLSTTSCGATNLSLTSNITCVAVTGANQYQWEFSTVPGGSVYANATTSGVTLNLGMVNPAVQWNTTYSVRVRAVISGNTGTYSTACLITLMQDPALSGVPDTRLNSASCSNQTLSPTSSIVALTVTGANQYEFEFRLTSNGNLYATQTSNSSTLFLSNVNPNLQWGTQYNVRVRAYIAGVAGNYSQTCTIGLIPDPALGVPNTTLRSQDCGRLNFLISNSIVANAVAGATAYEFEFRLASDNSLYATKNQTSRTLLLSSVTPALQAGTQYNVRVRAFIGSYAGNFSSVCLIGIVSGSRETEAEISNQEGGDGTDLLELSVQPNPFTVNSAIRLNAPDTDLQMTYRIFDASGRLINQGTQPAHHVLNMGSDWIPGMYQVVVQAGSFTKTVRLIKIRD